MAETCVGLWLMAMWQTGGYVQHEARQRQRLGSLLSAIRGVCSANGCNLLGGGGDGMRVFVRVVVHVGCDDFCATTTTMMYVGGFEEECFFMLPAPIVGCRWG
jgi:hypothetical protein